MSRIIEFRKSAQKAAKQSVQGKTCAFTGHRPQSLPFGFDESDKRCTSLKSVMRDQCIRRWPAATVAELSGRCAA